MCVFYYRRTYYKAVRVGGGGEWRTCAMRDDEPRPVWMSLPSLAAVLRTEDMFAIFRCVPDLEPTQGGAESVLLLEGKKKKAGKN